MTGAHRVTSSDPERRSLAVQIVEGIALVVVVGFLVVAGAWRLNGGHWERVQTPSMGQTAPVGTLLWVKPVDFTSLEPGDFITFQPPTMASTVSHRIFTMDRDGTFTTKGELTLPDPWKLTKKDVVGKVEARWWVVGWFIKAAPVLIVGALLMTALVRFGMPAEWKLPAAIVGVSLVLCTAIALYRPLVNAKQLSFVAAESGAQATFVSTGMLPIKLTAPSGGIAVMAPGQVGSVTSTKPNKFGKYEVSIDLNARWWWWPLIVLICFAPAFWTYVLMPKDEPEDSDSEDDDPEDDDPEDDDPESSDNPPGIDQTEVVT